MRFRLAHPKSLHYSKCEGLRWSSRVVVSKGYLSIPWYKKLTLHKSNVVKFVLAIALIARVLSDVSVKPNDCCSWYLVTANHLWKYPRDLNISFTISLTSIQCKILFSFIPVASSTFHSTSKQELKTPPGNKVQICSFTFSSSSKMALITSKSSANLKSPFILKLCALCSVHGRDHVMARFNLSKSMHSHFSWTFLSKGERCMRLSLCEETTQRTATTPGNFTPYL